MDLLWAIEGARTPFLNFLFSWITRLGEQNLLIVVFCVLFWSLNKRMAYGLGVAFFISSLAVQGLKVIFRVPRPWVADPTFPVVEGSVYEATGYAFPSGHTQNAASIFGSLGVCIKQMPVKIACFSILILAAKGNARHVIFKSLSLLITPVL